MALEDCSTQASLRLPLAEQLARRQALNQPSQTKSWQQYLPVALLELLQERLELEWVPAAQLAPDQFRESEQSQRELDQRQEQAQESRLGPAQLPEQLAMRAG